MAQLLQDEDEKLLLYPQQLISLKDARIPGGAYAMRDLDKEHLESLRLSDPATWKPILTTLCTQGDIVIDGNHRWEIAKEKQIRLKAIRRAYQSEDEVVEMAFRANLDHGLKASMQTKGDYAYWLHVTHPELEQNDIAARVRMTQGAVSKAIARRDEDARKAMVGESIDPDEQKKFVKKSCRRFARFAIRFLGDVEQLEDAELIDLLGSVVKKSEDKAKLLRIGTLLTHRSTTYQTQRDFIPPSSSVS